MFDLRLEQEQCALAEVIHDQRGEHQREPGHPDGTLPEMPHVRIQRFPTRDDEKHRAKHGESDEAVVEEERHGMTWVEGTEHRWKSCRPHDAEHGEGDKPDHHDRAEQPSQSVGPVLLDHEQADQDGDGNRHHVRLEQRRRDLEALDRAEHGHRRRNHAVAVEQRGAEDTESDEYRSADCKPWCSGVSAGPARNQRGQCEHTTFALVVGTHHDRDVLDRDDEDQRVDDERQHAEHVLVRRWHRVRPKEALAQCVYGTGPDVAVDDAEGRECEWD